jgi:hypothetical protein
LAYTKLIPTLPPLTTGLSPLLEWIIVPVFALFVARRYALRHTGI